MVVKSNNILKFKEGAAEVRREGEKCRKIIQFTEGVRLLHLSQGSNQPGKSMPQRDATVS
jgi:hypothetical protein